MRSMGSIHISDASRLKVIIGLSALSLACGKAASPDKRQADDQPSPQDMGLGQDAGELPEPEPEPEPAVVPTTCDAACREPTLSARFGAQRSSLGVAFYGLSAPSTTDSGQLELYLEAAEGGAPGCPAQDSPTPKRTLILSGLTLPLSPAALTQERGVRLKLIDYEGSLLGGDLFADPIQVTVTPLAARLCVECLGQPAPSSPDGFIALELKATFAQGQLEGRLYATHCDSMDAR